MSRRIRQRPGRRRGACVVQGGQSCEPLPTRVGGAVGAPGGAAADPDTSSSPSLGVKSGSLTAMMAQNPADAADMRLTVAVTHTLFWLSL